ncbi:FecR family protein [Pedobacter heparinus]|uniref:FecR family protein n=1 Tax=Pedobacter heparinus TaxID=984 RepID=UPI00292E2916|nr:FecR domain-containing protein [Pedobacter heparinus]
MEETRLAWLFRQYFDDQISSELELELFEMLESGRYTAELEQLMKDCWEKLDAEQPFDRLARTRMLNAIYAAESDTVPVQAKMIRWNGFAGLASFAAAIAICTLGIWLYYASGLFGGHHPGSPLANDIAPGKNGATLRLANGKVITLSDAKTGLIIAVDGLKYNDGKAVDNDGNAVERWDDGKGINGEEALRKAQMLNLTTSRGQTYQVTLPDGTKVWLNADSKIDFPSQFTDMERRISIIGEAYFEVAKNKDKPFIVETDGQEVTVLGTHFNVSAYKGEGIKTTLLEGLVRVQSAKANHSGSVILHPNQQSTLTTGNEINVRAVDATNIIAWKNGRFAFNSANLEAVLKEMGRWYNVDIRYPDGIPDERFTGNIDRNNTLTQTVDILKFMKVNFEIDGRTIIVKK